MECIERFCELVRQNLGDFTFEDKRLALEALQVEVRIDSKKVTIKGAVPVIEGDIESTLPCLRRSSRLIWSWREGMASNATSDMIGRR